MKNPREPNENSTINFFYDIILEKQLIERQKLNRIKQEQEEIYEKKESGGTCSWGIGEELSHQTSAVME